MKYRTDHIVNMRERVAMKKKIINGKLRTSYEYIAMGIAGYIGLLILILFTDVIYNNVACFVIAVLLILCIISIAAGVNIRMGVNGKSLLYK